MREMSIFRWSEEGYIPAFIFSEEESSVLSSAEGIHHVNPTRFVSEIAHTLIPIDTGGKRDHGEAGRRLWQEAKKALLLSRFLVNFLVTVIFFFLGEIFP